MSDLSSVQLEAAAQSEIAAVHRISGVEAANQCDHSHHWRGGRTWGLAVVDIRVCLSSQGAA